MTRLTFRAPHVRHRRHHKEQERQIICARVHRDACPLLEPLPGERPSLFSLKHWELRQNTDAHAERDPPCLHAASCPAPLSELTPQQRGRFGLVSVNDLQHRGHTHRTDSCRLETCAASLLLRAAPPPCVQHRGQLLTSTSQWGSKSGTRAQSCIITPWLASDDGKCVWNHTHFSCCWWNHWLILTSL